MNDSFLAFEKSYKAKGYTESTNVEVNRRLGNFKTYLEKRQIENVDGITKGLIMEYQVELSQSLNKNGRLHSIRYQNLLFSAAKLFMRFLKENEYIISDPSETIAYAKQPQILPRSILTPSEARKIMNAADTASLTGYRNRTVLEVLYSTGIRRNELHDLTLNDVDYRDGFLRIMGKGRKERIVPLGRIACRYLENYIKSIRPELIKDPLNNHVFLSILGNKFSKNIIIKFIKEYAKKAGIKKNVHPHTFRHTCATVMLKNKANIRVVQELLGHCSLTSTQIYTRITINDLKEVHKNCHPREKDKS